MNEENEFYVYMYLRKNGTPYYVGKGKGDRAFRTHNRRIRPPKDKSRIVFHTKDLSEDKAFALEVELIAKYGRIDNGTGILRNLTDGGEGTSGLIMSDEFRAKHKEAMSKPEIKTKFRERMDRPEVRSKRKETMNRPEVRAKRKETMNRPEVRAKISRNNGMKRPEVRAKCKETLNRPEVKSKHKEIMKEINNRHEVKAKRKEALNRPEVRAKRKEALNRPEVRAKLSRNNPMKNPETVAKALATRARKKAEALAAVSENNLIKFFDDVSTELDSVAEKQQS
ncbi:hypothetical protein EBS02_03090 [bacterium]|nr:hypothetical protein [bacterium]